MKYVCLVYGEESRLAAMSKAEMARLDASALAYDRNLESNGKLIVAQALQSVKKSKTIRVRGGKKLVTDGPFAETKEQLLGFIMIEARDAEEALEIGGKSPLAEIGAIEVREIYIVPGS